MAAARGNRSNTNTAGNLDPYRVPWFADCAPSLLTNRTIRRYLNAYSQHAWPEVIKLTLIYGVLGLEQQFPGGTLSIPQLRQLVEKGGAQLVVQRNLPGLQRQILDLQTNLDAVFDRLAVEPPPVAALGAATTTHAQAGAPQQQQQQQQRQQQAAAVLPAQLAQRAQQQQQQQQQVLEFPTAQAPSARPATAALNPGPVAPKPPDVWRLGEKTGFPSPPCSRDHPLRRSLDNQGATNPIYPDWWMAAGPPAPPARKVAPQKAPRKQPRLAYSVQQQQPHEARAAAAAADDLVTAEYLMVPGSGYGQGVAAPVVAGADPPVTVTRITADSMQTNALFDVAQQLPAAAAATVAGAGAGASASRGGVTAAAGAGGGASRRPQAAQSKIREMVAASRRKAAAQQQRRQQLLASAVAAGSSLFGDAPQQQQVPSRAAAATAEAVAACAPAAAAEQFLSNPWTACFLQPSAVRPDVFSFTGLPAANISADDEGRLGVLADEGGQLQMGPGEALGQPTAPAAYAVLQRVVAGGSGSTSAVGGGGGDLLGVAGGAGQVHQEVGLQQQPEGELQQEQVEGLLAAGSSTQTKGPAAAAGASSRAAGAQAGSSRGVFADITSGLNSQGAAAAAGAAAAGGGGVGAPQGAFASWGHPQLGSQLEAAVAAAAAAAREASQQSVDDWRNLPLVGEEEQESHLQAQQQRQQQQQREAWVHDYGHLEGVQPPPARASAAGREGGRAPGKPHKRWSETWVGDFGHLQQFPRFARDTAFQHQREAAGDAAAGGGSSRPPSKLFMSPADLQAMVAAADRLQSQPARAAGSQRSPDRPDSAAGGSSAAAAAAGGGGWEAGASAGTATGPSSEATAAGIEGSSSSAHSSLAARFAELLCRWDTQAADSAGELPAGVAARARVEHVAAGVRAAAAEDVAAGQQTVEGAAAAAEDTASSSSSYNTAGSDGEVAAAADTEQQPSRLDASAALDVAAADAAALLLNLQQAVSELSAATTDSQAAGAAAGAAAPAASAAAADEEEAADLAAAGEAGGALGVSLPAENHLDGMQEASQMLQQALSRHDALMQLIASLGGAPGSDNTLLESSTASGSELTV